MKLKNKRKVTKSTLVSVKIFFTLIPHSRTINKFTKINLNNIIRLTLFYFSFLSETGTNMQHFIKVQHNIKKKTN